MSLQFEMDAAAGGNAGKIVQLSDLYAELGATSPSSSETSIIQSALLQAEGAVVSHLGYYPVISQRIEFYPQMNFAGRREGVWEANQNSAYFREISGSQSDELQLIGLPLRASNSSGTQEIEIRVDYDGRNGAREGSFGSTTIKQSGVDYFPNYTVVDSSGVAICVDGIVRSFGLWPSLAGSVKVTYLAGYTANELLGNDTLLDASPIRESVIDEATRRVLKKFSRRKRSAGWVGPLTSESLGDYSYSVDSAVNGKLIGTESTLLAETVLKLEPFVNMGIRISG